jgi:hypothetical protein
MIVGIQLGKHQNDQIRSLLFKHRTTRCATWHETGLAVRIIERLCAILEVRAPLGYEDESGFHYGVDTTDQAFSI